MPSRSKKLIDGKNAKKPKEKAANPFEVRVNRKKHEVLGQRGKSDVGQPGISRSKAIQKRKKTLLVEYKHKNKSNKLLDRRFGEGKELSIEDKMMQRFMLERKRKHKHSNVFNLNDEEDNLTHYGQSIGDMEKFDDIILSDEEVKEDIGETHFGGFLKRKRPLVETGEEVRPKTKQQIMNELVAKSKAMKYERQSEKMEVENLMESVDTELKTIQNLLSKSEDKGGSKMVDDYDCSVRELQFERRGKPLNRMKTEEELAREEKERLEKLEVDRVRRMKGLPPDQDTKHLSADFIADLVPSTKKKDTRFILRYKDGKMVLPDGVEDGGTGSLEDEGEEEDEEGEEEDEEEEDEEWEEGEEEEEDDSEEEEEEDEGAGLCYGSDLDSDDAVDEEAVADKEKKKSQSQMEQILLASEELPYTFTVPRSLDEFCSIVEHRSPEECLTAVERIHSCNHPSISPTNKLQLQDFLSILLDYCLMIGKTPDTSCLATLDKLVGPLFRLVRLSPQNASVIFRQVLSAEYKQWSLRRREFPPTSTLILFQLTALMFPASDFQHPVITPAFQFLGQVLAKAQVKSASNLLQGLLTCKIVMEYICSSKRFMPELVNFLTSSVGYFSNSEKCIFLPPFTAKCKLWRESEDGDGMVDTTLSQMLTHSSDGDLPTHSKQHHLLKVILNMILRLLQLYKHLPSFPEIFAYLDANLESVSSESWPQPLMESILLVRKNYFELASRPREVLQLLKQKPKSIKFYEPKFDQIYEVSKRKSRGKLAGEKQKLKYKVKKETKGAIREIRKDAAFLAKVKLDETLLLDAERQRKTRQLMHELQSQQHEAKVERLRAKKR